MTEPFIITVVAPVGPVKDWWINTNQKKHWARRQPVTLAWRARGSFAARGAPRVQQAHIHAALHFGDLARRDAHNYTDTVKAAIDGLVDEAILPDDNDKHLLSLTVVRGDKAPIGDRRQCIVLTVTPVQVVS